MATARNSAVVQYPAATASGIDVTHLAVWTNEATPKLVMKSAVSGDPPAIQSGSRFSIAANALTLEIPNGAFTAEGAKRGITGLVAGGLRVSLHTGDPGSDGTANEITESWYARQTVAQAGWTIA